MSDQRIYVNSLLMRRGDGDDTQWTIDLGARYTFKTMTLNGFVCDNLFQNMYDIYQDLSYQVNTGVGVVTVTLTIDHYVTKDQMVAWFNAQGGALQLQSIALPAWDYRLSYQAVNAAHTWNPVGAGWTKLGFVGGALNRTQTATSSYDFSQSPVVLVRFDNLSNAVSNAWGRHSFQVENTASFGGKIVKQYPTSEGNQVLKLSQPATINSLSVTLLNCDGKKMMTVGGNQNGIEVLMDLSIRLD